MGKNCARTSWETQTFHTQTSLESKYIKLENERRQCTIWREREISGRVGRDFHNCCVCVGNACVGPLCYTASFIHIIAGQKPSQFCVLSPLSLTFSFYLQRMAMGDNHQSQLIKQFSQLFCICLCYLGHDIWSHTFAFTSCIDKYFHYLHAAHILIRL